MSAQKIVKWGNSLAVRLPSAFARSVRLSEGAVVDITVDDGKIVIEPVVEAEVSLSRLVQGITPENVHRETNTGAPLGRETW